MSHDGGLRIGAAWGVVVSVGLALASAAGCIPQSTDPIVPPFLYDAGTRDGGSPDDAGKAGEDATDDVSAEDAGVDADAASGADAAAAVDAVADASDASLDAGTIVDAAPDADLDAAADADSDAAVDSSADTGTDATVDGGADAAQDAASDGSGDAAQAGCQPATMSSWSAPPFVPAESPQFACTQQEMDTYFAACLASSVAAPCNAFADGGVGSVCNACLETPEAASPYGPVVDRVVPRINVAACVQQMDPSVAGIDCARAFQAAEACVEASCRASCPVTDSPSANAFDACTRAAAAAGGPCEAYAQAAALCAGEEQDGGAASPCFSGATPYDQFATTAGLLCRQAIGSPVRAP